MSLLVGYILKNPSINSKGAVLVYLGVSKNSGTPKWMVKIMEKPIRMDDFGGENPTIFGNIQFGGYLLSCAFVGFWGGCWPSPQRHPAQPAPPQPSPSEYRPKSSAACAASSAGMRSSWANLVVLFGLGLRGSGYWMQLVICRFITLGFGDI